VKCQALFSKDIFLNGECSLRRLLDIAHPRCQVIAPDENPMWVDTEDLSNDKDITILTGGLETYSDDVMAELNIKIKRWPTYFLEKVVHTQSINQRSVTPKRLYISLNGEARYHRCYMMDQLCKHNLLQFGYISWHSLRFYDWYKWEYWNPKILLLQSKIADINQIVDVLPTEWFLSAINLVTETDARKTFITEKTAMPLLHGKPFIVLGAKGFHKHLQDLGFKLYPIFDYSFDDESKIFDRVAGIIQNLDRLSKYNPNDLYQECLETIEYNQKQLSQIGYAEGNFFSQKFSAKSA